MIAITVRYGWHGVRGIAAVMTCDEKQRQEQRLYHVYSSGVLRDIASGLFGGQYDRPVYAELLNVLIGGEKVDDKRTAQDIIEHLMSVL